MPAENIILQRERERDRKRREQKMKNLDKQSWHCSYGMEMEERDRLHFLLHYPESLTVSPLRLPHSQKASLFLFPLSVVLQSLRCDGSSVHSMEVSCLHISGPVSASACLPLLPAAYESYNRLPVMLIK